MFYTRDSKQAAKLKFLFNFHFFSAGGYASVNMSKFQMDSYSIWDQTVNSRSGQLDRPFYWVGDEFVNLHKSGITLHY